MKDYRQYSKAYKPEEWEDNKEWLARRLEFLWTFGDYYPQLYSGRHLGDEKEEMYCYFGSDNEVSKMAYDFHYGQYNDRNQKLELKNCYKIFAEYEKLEKLKNSNMDMFLRKRFYIRYYHLREFISDNELFQDYEEYLKF